MTEKISTRDIFKIIKENKENINFNELRKNRNNLLPKAQKVLKTGQKRVAQNMLLTLNAISKEMLAVQSGYDVFVDKNLLFEYMEKCDTRSIVLNYLKDFPREIPDDIVAKIDDLKKKNIFDEFVIVFTDYTGEERSKVSEDLKEKDPIIFGIFCDLKEKFVYDRFYFIADWEDEFCDLTLEKLIIEQRNINPKQKIVDKSHIDDFSDDDVSEILQNLENIVVTKPKDFEKSDNKKLTIMQRLKNIFKK